MAKCVFCNEEARSAPVVERARLQAVDCAGCGSYMYLPHENWVQKQTTAGPFHPQNAGLVYETLRLNRQDLTPLWTNNAAAHRPDLEKSPIPRVQVHGIEEFARYRPLHRSKPLDILQMVADKSEQNPFAFGGFSIRDLRNLRLLGWGELYRWLIMLRQDGYIDAGHERDRTKALGPAPSEATISGYNWGMLPKGYLYLEEQRGPRSSSSAFVALSFGARKDEIASAIDAACKTAGYRAVWSDKDPTPNGIMDEVLGLIRQSRFLVADLTEQKHGVYYEAGFALGIGLPVFFSCQEDDFSNLHFDVKHTYVIKWELLKI